MNASIRRFGGRSLDRPQARLREMMDSVKRFFLPLVSLVAAASIGWGGYVSAGAATSHSSRFCSSMKPGVQASQQLKLKLKVNGLSSHTVAKTKSQLLTEIDTILDTFRSVRVNLRSAPAVVRSSFMWDVSATGKAKAALKHATTQRQIRVAVAEISGPLPKEEPFIIYILSTCESPVPPSTPTTP
jgi:hypothetical protein